MTDAVVGERFCTVFGGCVFAGILEKQDEYHVLLEREGHGYHFIVWPEEEIVPCYSPRPRWWQPKPPPWPIINGRTGYDAR